MAKLAATIGAHIAVNSGDAALGGDPVEVVFSALSVPPTLVLPPGGLALTSITGFIEALFEGDGLFAGSGLGKGSFPSEVLALKDVYLTQFELDVSDELAPATFLLGLEYETAWPLPGVSDLPGFAGLQLANPGIVLQSFGPRVELYGTLEIQGVNVLASVSWPQVQLSASLLPPSVLSSNNTSFDCAYFTALSTAVLSQEKLLPNDILMTCAPLSTA